MRISRYDIDNKSRIGNASDIDIVFREAEMLKLLKHPHIVSIDSCVTLPGLHVAFVMDYLNGGDLFSYI